MTRDSTTKQDEFFALEAAEQVEFDGERPFLLPLCEAKAGILMGGDVGILILKAVDGTRLGIPVGHDAPSTLYQVIGKAIRGLKPDAEVMQ